MELVGQIDTKHYGKWSLDDQYRCTVFCFELISWKVILTRRRNITEKYFFRVWVRVNMLSDDDDAAIVAAA